MKKLISIVCVCVAIAGCTASKKGKTGNEKVPDIAGTWYQDEKKDAPCYIVQNERDLVFLSGKESSTGHFKNSIEVFAKDWNRNAMLSANHQTLRWADRTWTKGTFTYPNISGVWYEDGDPVKQINIIQTETKLVMDNGSQKLNGYFYTTNAIYSLENNNYGIYDPAKSIIKWGGKTWMRKVKS
jgi:hypothetical protein